MPNEINLRAVVEDLVRKLPPETVNGMVAMKRAGTLRPAIIRALYRTLASSFATPVIAGMLRKEVSPILTETLAIVRGTGQTPMMTVRGGADAYRRRVR